MEVELTADLVGGATVGDVVTVMGWVKVLATGDNLGECALVLLAACLLALVTDLLAVDVAWNTMALVGT